MTNRRSFLQLLGVAPIAGPAAAKAAVDAAISEMAGVRAPLGVGGMAGPTYGSAGAAQSGAGSTTPYVSFSNYVKTFGLPKFAEADFRDRAREVWQLDHDIANKRSWSMAVKIVTQRQRNYERMVRNVEEAGWRSVAKEAVQKTVGSWWPW